MLGENGRRKEGTAAEMGLLSHVRGRPRRPPTLGCTTTFRGRRPSRHFSHVPSIEVTKFSSMPRSLHASPAPTVLEWRGARTTGPGVEASARCTQRGRTLFPHLRREDLGLEGTIGCATTFRGRRLGRHFPHVPSIEVTKFSSMPRSLDASPAPTVLERRGARTTGPLAHTWAQGTTVVGGFFPIP